MSPTSPIAALADHRVRLNRRTHGGSLRLIDRRDNLPTSLSGFVGREEQVGQVRQLLADTRLLTLTGTAGVGKTRLALQVASGIADSFADGLWLVDLAPLDDGQLLAHAVAAALGVHEQPGRPLLATLTDALRHRQLLLILDNCEHLIDASAGLAGSLLRACPRLQILATSREALHVSGETTWRVAPLSLPTLELLEATSAASASDLMGYEAIRLFVERVQTVLPHFKVAGRDMLIVANLCRQLDGIPLALELAAARVPALGIEQLARRLDNRFQVLVGGDRSALPRQQTLRAVVDWGYTLLPEPEQVLLRRLSVFWDGWTLEAAEGICGGEGLAQGDVLPGLLHLIDTSHVSVDEHAGEMRYRLLETLRQYATEKLREAGEEPVLRLRHLEWFTRLAEQAEEGLWGPEAPAWMRELKLESNNLRSALEWSERALARRGDANLAATTGLRLGGALWHFWNLTGQISEARTRLLTLLRAGTDSPSIRAKAMHAAAYLSFQHGDVAGGGRLAAETVALGPDVIHPFLRASALAGVALGMLRAGDQAGASAQCEEGVRHSRHAGDRRGMYYALYGLAEVARAQGDLERAIRHMEHAHALTREVADAWSIGFALSILGNLNLLARESTRAEALQQESLVLRHAIRDGVGVGRSLEGLGWVVSSRGHAVRAARLFGAADAVRERFGAAPHPQWQAERERYRALSLTRLGEAGFAAAWAEGSALDFDQAVAYALGTEPTLESLGPPGKQARLAEAPGTLSRREREVAVLVAQGCTNREIADKLVISQRTAEGHVERIRGKLGFQSRAQVAAWVVECRLSAA